MKNLPCFLVSLVASILMLCIIANGDGTEDWNYMQKSAQAADMQQATLSTSLEQRVKELESKVKDLEEKTTMQEQIIQSLIKWQGRAIDMDLDLDKIAMSEPR
jgi:TolA-binding protein